jgi:PPOX class probable FMN-dependent enzyme
MSPFRERNTSEDELREHYRRPTETTERKRIDHLDEHCRAFVAHSTFVLVATAAPDGTVDVSPKGGPPGFVVVLDDHRLAIPDLAGNNLLDSLTNLLHADGVGLLFVIPGLEETLRVNGHASLTRDPEVLDACAVKDRRPTAAIGVDVSEAFIHCAKAFRRGALWRPEEWPDRADLATPGCMLRDHIELEGISGDQFDELLEKGYAATLWEPGG